MIGMKLARSLIVPAFVAISLPISAQVSPSVQAQRHALETTAQLIGVSAEIDQLQKLSGSTAQADRWQILWLHQYISEQVMAASLQVDATIAQIDNEIATCNEVRGYLSDRRDRTVVRANLLSSLVGGSVSTVSSGLGLSDNLSKPSNAVGIAAGAFSTGFALIGIHARNGETMSFEFPANMLAEFFDRPILPNSTYPPIVWNFLNEGSPNLPAGVTRKQNLLQTWVQIRRIDSLNSKEIDYLTSQPAQQLKLSIDDYEDRAAMLQDVRARISYLKRDLGTLLASLPPVADTP
ncbi:hypothetical protein H7849_01130 [Alloacidobacterium dinghuense]|uniref:Uncharacterized protein n=1 Tax=Alloacidobacterium dinghuense TaxID=2763107 RepID=A0A7G8BJD3_9BACT|nr:hypothetical protein [Alloacidobacterium dinghuense]QNI32653.1 hypothetical protein H7849_01130 [Alloacidobacterium dinghuense]